MAAEQRFCPICDEAFVDGDAVLRCTGCGLLYHPHCWVREDGCTTPGDHDRTPMALAYPPVAMVFGSRPTIESPRRTGPRPELPPERRLRVHSDVVIGQEPAPTLGDRPEAEGVSPRPRLPTVPYAPRRGDRRGVPSNLAVYERRRWARYWYVPVAAVLAGMVALAVVIVGERLLGGESSVPSTQPTLTAVPTESPAGSPTAQLGTATPTPLGDASTPTASARFSTGQRLKVTGTGECLNVRVQPGLERDVVACIADGTEVVVLGGPREADGYRWWQLTTPQGDGWAVENYLAPSP